MSLNGEGLLAVKPDLSQAVVQAQSVFQSGLQIGVAIQGHAAEQYRVIFQGGVQEHALEAFDGHCRRDRPRRPPG